MSEKPPQTALGYGTSFTPNPQCPVCPPEHCQHVTTPEMARTHELLMLMTEDQRGRVLCWFCSACHRYVGPGDSCTCTCDD